MSGFIRINEVFEKGIGDVVSIHGWIHRTRHSGAIAFLVMRDSTGIVQATVLKDLVENFDEVAGLLVESSLEITGEIVEDRRAPGGREIRVQAVNIVGPSGDFPIAKDKSDEYLLDIRHLWLRSREMQASFKIRSSVFNLFREYFDDRGFYEMHMPIFVSGAVEGGSTLFEVKYYDRKVYLTQSWQLYAEAMIYSLENIYNIAPTFRAEKSRTRRHLTEFWMAEVESAWIGNDEIIGIEEELVEFIVKGVLERNRGELELLGRDVSILEGIEAPFERMRYQEVLDELNSKSLDLEWGADLGYNEEKLLTEDRTSPMFITHFPREKGFYHRLDPDDDRVLLCNDLLAPEGYGEIIGAGERSYEMEELLGRMREENMDPEVYEWYLDLRRYGTVPHSGFGMGMDRVITWITGSDHIMKVIPFPRTKRRITP